MGEGRARWSKLPPAERERRMAQSAADQARARGAESAAPLVPEPERRRRQSQSDASRARAQRWAGLPEAERRRRQSQSDGARAAAAHEASLPEADRHRLQQQRAAAKAEARREHEAQRARRPHHRVAAEVAELENDETLQAMWNTIEDGGDDFTSKDDW